MLTIIINMKTIASLIVPIGLPRPELGVARPGDEAITNFQCHRPILYCLL